MTTATESVQLSIIDPVDAASAADDLRGLLMRIARMDAHPRTNAIPLEACRREALAITESLSAFLLASDTFGGL